MKKRIAILGSTGSIGTQTLDIVRDHKELAVTALAAGSNVSLMEKQIREFGPAVAVMWDEESSRDLRERIKDLPVRVLSGMEGLLELAVMEETDILVTAIVGMIGIRPTIAAIRAGKDIALANKETLVTAGHIIMPLAEEKGVSILPVDSEHSAIFQSLNGEKASQMEKILLTASGGPFRGRKREEMEHVTVEDALRHPNWAMGRKITIDSATMVNKGLEVIEARWLFDAAPEQIRVIVHPQSIIHSMVQFRDGSIIAQLGMPDMRLPIQYALFYPEREYLDGQRVDFFRLSRMTFEEPDLQAFPGLALAYRALETGGSLPTVYNAANEKAVSLFLERKLSFLRIPELIGEAMEHHRLIQNPTVEEILETERESYEFIMKRIETTERRGCL
ncbi:MAG: 1-deoxy-D-xylulose-5-phosphate reductoisomerase [Lachnospiraceae bacterium]|nr:1-deoxy-D-xylulose-5-phosphate reductoisomerase [Lachnospiraceae bacterium]